MRSEPKNVKTSRNTSRKKKTINNSKTNGNHSTSPIGCLDTLPSYGGGSLRLDPNPRETHNTHMTHISSHTKHQRETCQTKDWRSKAHQQQSGASPIDAKNHPYSSNNPRTQKTPQTHNLQNTKNIPNMAPIHKPRSPTVWQTINIRNHHLPHQQEQRNDQETRGHTHWGHLHDPERHNTHTIRHHRNTRPHTLKQPDHIPCHTTEP